MCVFVCELHGFILLAAGSSCPRQFTKDCASSSVKDNSNVFICINFRSLYSALLNWILFLNCQISWTKVSLFLFNFMLFILRILPFLYKLRNKYDDRPKSNSLTSDFLLIHWLSRQGEELASGSSILLFTNMMSLVMYLIFLSFLKSLL